MNIRLGQLESQTLKINEYRQKSLDWYQDTMDTKFTRKLIVLTNSALLSN